MDMDMDIDEEVSPYECAKAIGVDPKLLDLELSDEPRIRIKISKHIDDWSEIAASLGLTKQEIKGIKTDPAMSSGKGLQARELLEKWKRRQGFKATYYYLVQAYLDLNENQTAESICREIAKVTTPYTKRRVNPEKEASDQPDCPDQYEGLCSVEHHHKQAVDIPDGARAGSVRPNVLWTGYYDNRPLKVHFLNPEMLVTHHWTYDKNPLTTDTILAWATYWNSHAEKYPKIDLVECEKKDAEIRVKFDSSTRSWSRVGKCALDVDKDEPTMVLNLNIRGMTAKTKRSMVLHEFGHALGLDHEHQRSDFWKVLNEKDNSGKPRFIIGIENMKCGHDGCSRACSEHLERPETDEPLVQTEYDGDSIMHYW